LSKSKSCIGGNLSKFKQVDAVGNLSCPDGCMAKFGIKFLNPNNGVLDRLVTNLSNILFSSSVRLSTTLQNIFITGLSEL
jgi:hypothetical protein